LPDHAPFSAIIIKKSKLLIHAMASTGTVKDAAKYLATQQAESPPELAAEWAKLEEFYNKK